MALKRLRTKQSKRVPLRLKYKIQKKIREYHRKVRKEAKKNRKGKSHKSKLIQIPNICPFKKEILEEVQQYKQKQEEERKKLKEMNHLKFQEKISEIKSLETIVERAENRNAQFVESRQTNEEDPRTSKNKGQNSLKAYYKEFKKVVDNADVLLEVVDARNPLGTRCKEIEEIIRSSLDNKRHVLILNKCDLIPKDNMTAWVKYLRKFCPVIPFKASTQNQTKGLGRKKMRQMATDKAMQSSNCIGAELLMALLGNYSRNNGVKTLIRVGVVGIPNVGKSSIINSLSRGKTCNVGSLPGITKNMKEIEVDSKIMLLDSPGVLFPSVDNESGILVNAQNIANTGDTIALAENILKRANKEYFCKLYDVTEYDSYDEFLAKKAGRMGKFIRGGIPDVNAAAKSLVNDWNSGKIKYCTQPPIDIDNECQLSATIVPIKHEEFDIDNYQAMEIDVIEKLGGEQNEKCIRIEEGMEIDTHKPEFKIQMETKIKNKSTNFESGIKRKSEPNEIPTEGNENRNKLIKLKQKKMKKQERRQNRKIGNVVDTLENISLTLNQDKFELDNEGDIDLN